MGIPGFTSFIDHNPQLLTDTKLSNCQIIIDGNNLYHFLYYYFHINHEYGGDYDTYYRKVTFFFETLKKCDIEPCVVFDGGHAQEDRKLKTSLRRARERLHLSGFLSHGGRGKVLPIFVYETFCNVLNDLNVRHVTCDHEADEQICALANAWNCPVLSNDGDFFIFDLTAGVVLLDYVNLKLHRDEDQGQSYINVQIYNLNNLLKLFKPMDRRCMPLIATLVGNDYVDAEQFEYFLHSIKLPKPSCSQVVSPKRHPKIVSVLLWLQSHKTMENAVGMIIKNTKKCKIDQIKKIIEESMQCYCKPNSQLADSLPLDCYIESPLPSTLKSYCGNFLPDWFLLQLHKGLLPVFMANVIVLHRQILLSQIEVMSEQSAYNCSKKVRQIIYGMLLTCDHLDHTDSDVDKSGPEQVIPNNCIVEYTRDKKTVLKSIIQPLYTLPNGELVPKLPEIPSLPEEKRLDVFCKALDLDKAHILQGSFPAEFLLLAAAIVTWIKHSDPKINNLHLAALLVGYFKSAALDPLGSEDEENIQPSDMTTAKTESAQEDDKFTPQNLQSLLREHCTQSELEAAYRNIEKYNVPAKHTNIIQFNGACIHAFSQFQASFLHTTYLAKLLLLSADRLCTPENVFNGTFLYSFYRELTNRKCPSLFIEELLGRSTYAKHLYNLLVNYITSTLNEGELLIYEKAGPTKRSKKSKGQKNKKSTIVKSHSTSSSDLLGKSENKKSTNYDIENRFGCLGIE